MPGILFTNARDHPVVVEIKVTQLDVLVHEAGADPEFRDDIDRRAVIVGVEAEMPSHQPIQPSFKLSFL